VQVVAAGLENPLSGANSRADLAVKTRAKARDQKSKF
jgi:hypothetical protein